jgi:hypothetical protein
MLVAAGADLLLEQAVVPALLANVPASDPLACAAVAKAPPKAWDSQAAVA